MDERTFQNLYAQIAARNRLDPNPDEPLHFYDYRAALAAGGRPDITGHWPSIYKKLGHPRLILGGIDTRNGKLASAQLLLANANAYQRALMAAQMRDKIGMWGGRGF